ncbi:hypothetical protein [Pontibacter saemangeumensis]
MENNTSQNQSNSSNSTNTGNNSNKDNKNAQHGNKSQQDASVLTMLHPHDMSRTVESALHVFQGNHDKLPELMQDVGQIILKATRRFTTTQLILAAGAVTMGAILLARYSHGHDEYEEA